MNSNVPMEILAPAGNMDALTAAVYSGANAVYLGLKRFSARRTAGNFDADELRQAVSFCHGRGVKVYVAINTTAHPAEVEGLCDALADVCAAGADAVILQDLAVAALARRMAPDLPIHGSTQMSVHTLEGALELAELGFSRVILARELSLAEIEHIAKNCPIEVEVFVHGALCMSVSGQCYMSAFLGGRSGNRGGCAGPCRLPFAADGSGACHLSLKDLSAVGSLPALAAAGVVSAKIEGRLRGPEYVAAAVNACRQSLAGQAYDEQVLQNVFSRSGFTNGYIEGKINGTMFGVRTAEDSAASKAVMPALRELYRREMPRVPVRFTLHCEEEGCKLTAADGEGNTAIAYTQNAPQKAEKDQRSAIERALGKTGGTPFYLESLTIEGEPGYLPGSEWNEVRRAALESLLKKRSAIKPWAFNRLPLPAANRHPLPAKLPLWGRFEHWEQLPENAESLAGLIVPVFEADKVPQNLRAKTVLELPRAMFGAMEEAVAKAIAATKNGGFAGYLAQNIAHFRLAKGLPLYGGFGLNITNPLAADTYGQLGLRAMTVLPEVPFNEMAAIAPGVPTWALVYGHMPLMLTRACPLQNVTDCAHCDKKGELTDRKNKHFPVRCGGGVRQVYNPVPLYLGDRTGEIPADAGVLLFTIESKEQAAKVIDRYRKGETWPGEFTRGLYYKPAQ
nr:DUF3656 domain-containing protein [Fournierella massiliensis]